MVEMMLVAYAMKHTANLGLAEGNDVFLNHNIHAENYVHFGNYIGRIRHHHTTTRART